VPSDVRIIGIIFAINRYDIGAKRLKEKERVLYCGRMILMIFYEIRFRRLNADRDVVMRSMDCDA